MKRLSMYGLLLFLAFFGLSSNQSMAQDSSVPIALEDLRYQFMAHNFMVGGFTQEVYIKLDTYTGQTWRFHASEPRWMAISEVFEQYPRDVSSLSRYELHTHDYLDTSGDPQELILRADVVTGHTWTYRGANGTWREVSQEDQVVQQ